MKKLVNFKAKAIRSTEKIKGGNNRYEGTLNSVAEREVVEGYSF